MIHLKLSKSKNCGIIETDFYNLSLIREKFSISNPAKGRYSKFTPSRIYSITPGGKFEIGLLKNIISFLEINQKHYNIDKELSEMFYNGFTDPKIKKYSLQYRDHQEKSIIQALKNGRGVICIPTAGGKTLIICGLIESLRLNMNDPNALSLVLVPSIQLVEQTAKDFEEYGMNNVTKWSGSNKLDSNASTIVANTQILLSEKTDLSILKNVKILMVDETHGLRRGNEINQIIDQIKTNYKFGFTGTLPPSLIDQWNIIGKIGPIVYQEKTLDLKEKNYVSDFKIYILKIIHQNIPKYDHNPALPSKAYDQEIEFLINNDQRNYIICNLCKKLTNNTILMVDRISHGLLLEKKMNEICKEENRPIYFIRGNTEIKERENIRKLMEEKNNVIVIAISKIFSTGINIPNLHNIVFASAGKAKIKILQSIGRALRLHPTKTRASIFDIADNTRYGRRHLTERENLYNNENYIYEEKTIY
jgi:superfamily II DNA or RNA helicase